MNEPQIPDDPKNVLALGILLGQRRAFGTIGGRCSGAHAHVLRRIHDEKLYLAVAPSWEAFCGTHFAITRRHADRLIDLLNRFGPAYFELAQLVGISPEQYVEIEPAVRENGILIDGALISLIPENAPKILEALAGILGPARRKQRRPSAPESLPDRLASLISRGRVVANQFLALYNSARSESHRELVLEAATELRLLLMQPGLPS